MPHVLIGGDERECERLCPLLLRRGLTVGVLPLSARLGALPGLQDCDAVVLVGRDAGLTDACLGAKPDGAGEAAGPAAPLLFLSRAADDADARLVTPGLPPSTGDLNTLLTAALAGAAGERRARAAGQPDEILIDQLGHELRSPLTAIKTALELLAGNNADGADAADGPLADSHLLEIALRNVRRLHRAVELSQVVLTAGEADGRAVPRADGNAAPAAEAAIAAEEESTAVPV